jgi:DnaJ-class molecular chaperone
MAAPPVDYYKVLEIDPKASDQQIRDAYKKAALKHHPDRVPSDSPERASRTKKFQQINDAYYTLSDTSRRRDYDEARRYTSFGSAPSPAPEDADDESSEPKPSWSFPWSRFTSDQSHNDFAHEQFGGIFEEMLREEGMAEGSNATPTGKFWAVVGGLSGGAMGFIVANFPGMVAGAVAGNRLGAVRDAKGKSVYQVFSELPQGDKARLLSELAAKVFAHAVGSG